MVDSTQVLVLALLVLLIAWRLLELFVSALAVVLVHVFLHAWTVVLGILHSSRAAGSAGLVGHRESLVFLSLLRHHNLEVWRELFFFVESRGEENSSDSARGVYLDSERFDVDGVVGSGSEVSQVELDLVPALVESHRHGADEWLHSGGRLKF